MESGIDDTQTVIPFDNSTLYGSFPSSGSFWIEDELITYTSIDDVNYEFEGCTRGSNASSHLITEYCNKKETSTPYVTFDASDIGSTWYFKLISSNVAGYTSDFEDAEENSLVIS